MTLRSGVLFSLSLSALALAGCGEPFTAEDPAAAAVPRDGLLLWLRADRGVTETSSVVSKWADQSGRNADATQATQELRPRLRDADWADLGVIEFDEDDYLKLPGGFADFSHGLSLFSVALMNGEGCFAALFHLGNGPEIDDIEWGRADTVAIGYEVADNFSSIGEFPGDEPQLLSVIHHPSATADDPYADVEVRRNRSLAGELSVPLPAQVQRNDNVLGKSLYECGSSIDGQLAELLIYARRVSTSEVVDIESYLQTKWKCCE